MKEILLVIVYFAFARAKDLHKQNRLKSVLQTSKKGFNAADSNTKKFDYININKEFSPIENSLIGTLNVLKKEYFVSFNIKPETYSIGFKNVIHLTLGENMNTYGDRNPGVWFHNDGSGRLRIYAAVNGDNIYYFDTPASIKSGEWSNVRIYQNINNGKYFFSIDINGINIHRVENSDARDFKNMMVYASDPWYPTQNGTLSDLQIFNGKPEFIVGNVSTPLVKGSLIAEIPNLDKEHLISFDFYPNKLESGWRNVIHFTIGSGGNNYGDRVPGIWFYEARLRVDLPINNNSFYTFFTKPIELNLWSNIEICQTSKDSVYEYTIKVNRELVFSKINQEAKSFDKVKVFASDPWHEVQEGSIKNLFVINGISGGGNQLINVFNPDFIDIKKEIFLTQGTLLGTLNVVKKEYFVSFNIKPVTYSVGFKSVLHITLGENMNTYGDRNPGVWFHNDGSGRLRIHAAVNSDNIYYFDTSAPLMLNEWSNIKIHQSLYGGKYWFSVDINGVNVHKVENSDARDFKNMMVFASDPWYPSQNGSISDLLIFNGKPDFIVGNIITPLVKGNLIAEIPKLDKEYLISFDLYPNKIDSGLYNIIHFTIGSRGGNYGDRVPEIWFNDDNKGGLRIDLPINNNSYYTYFTKPLAVKTWTNIEVSQISKGSVHLSIIKLNGEIAFSEINNQVQNFDNVKVFASNPWNNAQDGFIKNLFVLNGISNGGNEPITVFNLDYIEIKREFSLTQGSLVGTLNVLRKEYFVSFNVKPVTYSNICKNVLHLTLGGNIKTYGDRNPGVWFHNDGSGRARIYAAVNGNFKYYFDTTLPLSLGEWSNIRIYQSMYDGKYWFSVDINGVNIHKVENSDARDFKNMMVYASDPWYSAQDGSLSDLQIFNGKLEFIIGNVTTPLLKGKLIAEISKLDKEHLISFDIYPNKFKSGLHNVIHFTIGSSGGSYGDRVPGIWFNEDSKGGLRIDLPINNNPFYTFFSKSLDMQKWSNIEISQTLKGSIYLYIIKINGENVFSEINKQAQSFNHVKVFASNPWHNVQDGLIRNFFVINGN
ncbi:uncharacterized protein LOC136081866 [Hydra vulgaris]|uniref:Uncharacterized protein LOC136081866 n=1 Tax=Hydra vulgaris TaxID=6087 RepID=A0ABM4C3U7_HYDVU